MRALLAFALAFSAAACRYPNADEHFGLVADADHDGFSADVDCDDGDGDVHPDADEHCNDVDDDCDQAIDEDPVDPTSFWVDADSDGYGDDDQDVVHGCTAPDGYADVGGDCDDDDKDVHPGALDLSDDTFDQDCNGFDTVACAVDDDHDGFGADDLTTVFADDGSCDTADGEADNADDCLDTNANAHPGGQEIPGDGIDQDCSGADSPLCWTDDDGDGYGDPGLLIVVAACDGDGESTNDDDCDDTDETVHPGAPELCDGQIDACGGSLPVNEANPDGDAYAACTLDAGGWDGPGVVTAGNDCDDTDATVHPGAPELCDGQVNACGNSLPANEANPDHDAFAACALDAGGWDGTGTVTGGNDCKDSDATVFPGAAELCDGQDNDCDLALSDLEDDDDTDTYIECTVDGGWDGGGATPTAGIDCDDHNAQSFPNAPELCDGLDNDCNEGITDEVGHVSLQPTSGAWTDLSSTFNGSLPGRGAYTAAAPGTLWLCDGTYKASITVPTTIASFTIRGRNGAALTHLSGADTASATKVARVITTTGTDVGSITVRGLTIENGTASTGNGGGILFAGAPAAAVVQDCLIQGNLAALGGGIYLNAGTLTVSGTEMTANSAASGGAFYQHAGTSTFSGVDVHDNNATGGSGQGGGGLAVGDGTFTATDCDVLDNHATVNDGGALLMDVNTASASATFTDSTIDGNTSVDEGGAFACFEECVLTVIDTFVTNNTGVVSGAVDYDAAGGVFNCIATTPNAGAVKHNTATSTDIGANPGPAGGVLISVDGDTASSSHCDWGTALDDDDNLFTGSGGTVNVPADVSGNGYRNGTFGADRSFLCTYSACGPLP